jgi:sugar lactone lactonase YvrE
MRPSSRAARPHRRRHPATKIATTRRRPLFETLENRSLLATAPVQVLLMIGQSNMGGYPDTDELTPPLDAPQSDVWIWQDDLGQNVGWTSLRGGFGGDASNYTSGGDGNLFGPEVSFGRALADASPESQYAIVKHVQAGTGATMHDGWNPDRGGGAGPGQLWIGFVDKTNDALDQLSAAQLDYEIAGLIVFQGNRDAVNETGVEAATYEENFTDFISGVRQQFDAPQLPVVFARLPETRVVGSGDYYNRELVRAAQKAVDLGDPLATMIESDDFSRIEDGGHIDAEGQIGLGQRFADAYLGVPVEGSARVGSDGFESGSFSGGFEQWAGAAWTVSGEANVTPLNAPFDDAYHVRLSSSTGELIRAVDSTGLTAAKLRFWSKLDSFENGDKASVKVSTNGTSWTTLREFVDGEDDNVYRYHELELPDIGNTIYVRFDAEMTESSDYWYIDNVVIEGTTPAGGGAEFSISDATASEDNKSLKILDRFVQANSGGLVRPRAPLFGPDANGDGQQDLYVVSADTDKILLYDGQTGAFLRTFVEDSGRLVNPGDIAFGPDGDLYVSSIGTPAGLPPVPGVGSVLRYDGPDGTYLETITTGLSQPLGLTFGQDGRLYITNQGTNNVLRYDTAGLSEFVTSGSGGLSSARNAVFGPDGNLYVSSPDNGQILRFSGASGAFLNVFATTPASAAGPAWIQFGPDGNLYATSHAATSCCDTTLYRFHGSTGAQIDSFNLNRDGWSFRFGPDGFIYDSSNGEGIFDAEDDSYVERIGPSSLAAFTVSLSSPGTSPVTVNYTTASGSAAGGDFETASGTITFAPGQTSRTILVQTLDDPAYEGNETFTVNLSSPVGGVIIDGEGVGTIVDNDPAPTKFYVVDDGSTNKTYEYGPTGAAVENYALSSGNADPRGAASNVAGDKVWVVDKDKNVYVYNAAGGLLGSWTAGSLASNATVEGIATNGTDIWIVDARQDRVFRYAGAATRLSGSQNAASSFNLTSGNKDPKDIVTDGASLWVVNNASSDKVFKYTLSGSLLGSWTISGAGSSPTGITLDPASPSHLWIVDSGSDRVYQFDNAVNRTSGSQSPSTSFALAAGNTNPQGIADPPVAAGSARAPAGQDLALLAFLGELEEWTPVRKKGRR